MLKSLETMVEKGEGSYLPTRDLEVLRAYHRTFALRSETYRAVQEKESALMAEVGVALVKANPRIAKKYGPQAESKCTRDAASLLRYCALAMLIDDNAFLYDHFLHWLKTIMVAIDHMPLHRQVYPLLQEAIRKQLKPAQAELLGRYVAYAATTMA